MDRHFIIESSKTPHPISFVPIGSCDQLEHLFSWIFLGQYLLAISKHRYWTWHTKHQNVCSSIEPIIMQHFFTHSTLVSWSEQHQCNWMVCWRERKLTDWSEFIQFCPKLPLFISIKNGVEVLQHWRRGEYLILLLYVFFVVAQSVI